MLFYKMINICARLRDDQQTPPTPPPETYFILAETGDFITDESGNFLIQEMAP